MKPSLLRSYAALFGSVYMPGAVAIDCSTTALSELLPTNAKLDFAIRVPANGTFSPPGDNAGTPQSSVNLPGLCAISVSLNSGTNSSYGFGLFLPDSWNGRFLAVGNGGFSGGIQWRSMGSGVGYGFAVASTDTGHPSSAVGGTWATNPDTVRNWAYAAMHGTVVNAKHVTSGFYQQNITFSYYRGCSTGGRQGLKEAEVYPDDFDGIVAGAPAWWTKHLQPWTIYIGAKNLPLNSSSHLSIKDFGTLGAEVLRQCDAQDGLVDNIISNPRACIFRPETLLCGLSTSSKNSSCLTPAQLDTVNVIYSDWHRDNGSVIFPHLELGSEDQWAPLLGGSEPNSLGTDYPRYFLGLGANWRWQDFNISIVDLAEKLDPGSATVTNFDFSPFQKRGGKILMYHGWSDGLISTGSSTYFYNQVERAMGPKGVNLDDFYRFFLVPGMEHCSGTPPNVNAPWYFAGDSQATALGPGISGTPLYPNSPQHDVLLAMMHWVENGTAPDYLIGTKYVNDTTHDMVARQRPLCFYPKEAKYLGTGDVNKPESWSCQSRY